MMAKYHQLAVVEFSPAIVLPPSKRIIHQTRFHFYEKRGISHSQAWALLRRVQKRPVEILYMSIRRSEQ